jgi:hypothetical protein
MKGRETLTVRETCQQYLQLLADWLRPLGAWTRANGSTRKGTACALLGFLTGFLSLHAVLAPLADLTRDKARIESALAEACVAFWQH